LTVLGCLYSLCSDLQIAARLFQGHWVHSPTT